MQTPMMMTSCDSARFPVQRHYSVATGLHRCTLVYAPHADSLLTPNPLLPRTNSVTWEESPSRSSVNFPTRRKSGVEFPLHDISGIRLRSDHATLARQEKVRDAQV